MSLEKTEAVIRKEGSQWCIFSKSGKKLSCHSSREKALKRLRQIEFFKNKGMTSAEARVFCLFNGRNFEPDDFKDYNPEGNKK